MNHFKFFTTMALTIHLVMLFIVTTIIATFVVSGDYDGCQSPAARIEYIFPARPFGCWLGSIPGEK